MEEEIRFYYACEYYEEWVKRLKNYSELKYEGCFYETTIQYDHPSKENSFYNKKIDGRFRVRASKNTENGKAKSKISWKQRLPETSQGIVNREKEIEIDFKYSQLENLLFLLEKVIKMKNVESYERYRNVFYNNDVEIVVDKYPFGVALEIENKSKTKKAEEIITYWIKKLGLNFKDAFRLSWDDKYTELCKDQNIEIFKHIKFGLPMPKIIE